MMTSYFYSWNSAGTSAICQQKAHSEAWVVVCEGRIVVLVVVLLSSRVTLMTQKKVSGRGLSEQWKILLMMITAC